MPRMNGKNKLYTFTHYYVIDGWTKAKCAQLSKNRRASESEIIEEVLLKEIMPAHPFARKLVSERLFGEGGSVQVLLLALFQAAAYGVNVPSNLLPLAEFARLQEFDSHTKLTYENGALLPEMEARLSEFADAFHALLCELEDDKHKLDDDVNFRVELQLTRELLDTLQKAPQQVVLFNFYQLIVKYWDCISDRRKYGAMLCLVQLANRWRDAPVYAENKAELLDILKAVSAEWNDNAFGI